MKNWLKILVIFILIVGYIIAINLFASLIGFSHEQSQIIKTIRGGSIVEINVGTSVSVSVTRAPHWWGRMYENNGNSYLHLFELVMIPKKVKTYNFIWFHLIFLIGIILFAILIFTKKKIYKGENLNLEHEKLVENTLNHY